MSNPQKDKGDAAEREIAALLTEMLGVKVTRMLGAGRLEDVGDLHGVPHTTVQVSAARSSVGARVIAKPLGAELQRLRAGNPHAVTMLKIIGNGSRNWRAVMTLPQWCSLWLENQMLRARVAELEAALKV